ncbi:MAG TPA: hypothetical protein VFC46_17860, partial [Humisphaera sp.]|nr:hypothetical protein [Humisphaera sp.]
MPKTLLTFVLAVLLAALPALAAPPTTQPTTKPAQPTTKPTKRPVVRSATRPVLTAEELKLLKLRDLTRKSIELCEARKYAEAEAVIKQALEIEPDEPTNIYNMACLKALCDDPDVAMNFLEKSAELGFEDFIHIEQDTDLDSLRSLPRYQAMIAAKAKYQENAADVAIGALKKRLGDKYIYEVDPGAKLIFAANTDRQTLSAVKKWLSAQARSQWQQLFEHHPDQYIA